MTTARRYLVKVLALVLFAVAVAIGQALQGDEGAVAVVAAGLLALVVSLLIRGSK